MMLSIHGQISATGLIGFYPDSKRVVMTGPGGIRFWNPKKEGVGEVMKAKIMKTDLNCGYMNKVLKHVQVQVAQVLDSLSVNIL